MLNGSRYDIDWFTKEEIWDDQRVSDKPDSSETPRRTRIPQHSANPGIMRRRSRRTRGRTESQSRAQLTSVPKNTGGIRSIIEVPLRYLSASIVVVLSLVMATAYSITQLRDVVTITVVFAILILANGWSGLVHTPSRYPAAITATLIGVSTVFAVRITDDMAWGTVALGATVLVAAIVEMGRPQPREDLVKSISASAAAGLTAILGSAWVSLTTSPLWSVILIGAAVVTSLTVVGNQVGTSVQANALGSLGVGMIAGLFMGGVAIILGQDTHIIALAFPKLPGSISPTASIVVTSGVLGLAIGAVIAIVDGLVGEHNRRCTEAGAFARGATKFLMAVVPIYILVHIGAL